jgi:hypothetical protein
MPASGIGGEVRRSGSHFERTAPKVVEPPEEVIHCVHNHAAAGVMADIDDLWINAFAALPDVQPLVHLLRSDTPMPPGARDLLAELFSPGDPPISDFELVPKRIKKFDTMLDQLEIMATYAQKREAGQSAQDAAIEAGEAHGVEDRTIFRYREKLGSLGERLRGVDKPTKPR